MLERLHLENFKGHGELDAVFAPGLNLITGCNYSGKSTILHGILFAFFGVSAVPGGSKIVPRRGGRPADTKVMAQFYHAGDTYQVERKIASAKLYRGGKMIASSLSGVNKELESIFDVPQRMFLRLKYAEQGATQALLTLGIGELHRIIEHVSGVHLVNRVIDRSSKLASAAGSKLEVLGPLPDLIASEERETSLRESLQRVYKEAEGRNATLSDLAGKLEAAKTELDGAIRWNAVQARAEADRTALCNQIKQADESRRAALQALHDHQPLASKSEELERRSVELREIAGMRSRLESNAASLRADRDKQVRDLREAEAAAEKLRTELSGMPVPDVEKAVADRVAAGEVVRSLTTEVGKMRASITEAVCPACNRPFDGADVDRLLSKLEELKTSLSRAEHDYQRKSEKHKEALSKSSDWKQKENALYYADSRAAATRDTGANLVNAIRNTDRQLEEMPPAPTEEELSAAVQQSRAAQQALGAYWEADRTIGAVQGTINSLNDKLLRMPPVEDKVVLSQYESAVQFLTRELQNAESEMARTSSEYTEMYREWERLSEQLKRDRESASVIQSLHTERETATGLGKYLRDNRDRFMAALWEQVTAYASDFSSMCTGGAITQMERTRDGSFLYLEDGTAATMDGASGAQKSIMALGIQLALDTLLPDTFGALLLDEPTSQMDGEHSLAVTQALSQSGRQIVMVSHREMDASVAAAHIHLA